VGFLKGDQAVEAFPRRVGRLIELERGKSFARIKNLIRKHEIRKARKRKGGERFIALSNKYSLLSCFLVFVSSCLALFFVVASSLA
jgi:hypothetical protein